MINVLHLGLSYKCNMNCHHCYVTRKKDKLQENDFYNIIDTLYDAGLFIIYYTFGEPLCSDLLSKVSAYASEKGLIQILMTNGSLIDDNKINIIKENRISKVCISVDHIDSQKHDANRNYKNAYNKAIQALKLLTDNDIHTEMSVTVNDNNVMCLQDIYDLAENNNVEFISYLRERKEGRIVRLKQEKEYQDFFAKMILNKHSVNVLFHDMSLLPVLQRLKNENKIGESVYEKYYEMNCCHSKYTISVEPDGDVRKCNLQNNLIGNIFNTPLKEIIEKEGDNNDTFCCSTVS